MTLQWNKQAVLATGVGVALVVYIVYSVWPGYSHGSSGRAPSYDDPQSWKPGWFVDVPDHVLDAQEQVKVVENEVTFLVGDNEEVTIFYREAFPVEGTQTDLPVILLHGQGGTSQKWLDLGTLHIAAAAGHRIVAPDLLASGNTKTNTVSSKRKFLEAFLAKIQMDRPVLVPSSAGGNYALPYLMEPSPMSCESRARGLATIGVVGSHRYTPSQYHRCEIPTMIVYGEKDKEYGLVSVGDLRNLANREIFPIEKAGHSCHYEKPDEWHKLFYNFLLALKHIYES